MRRLRRLLGLDPEDRRLLATAWVRLFVVSAGLRWLGYRRLSTWVPTVQQRGVRAAEMVSAQRYAYWITVAARWQPMQALCLAQSVALQGWLRGEGVPSDLRIGVSKAGAQLAAHAWVELDGVPINDTPGSVAVFTPLAQMREAAADPGQHTAPLAPSAPR
jgi:hypothetical protein